jgi:hypothetical protein
MASKSKIPSRNQNWTGWWVYEEVEQWVSKRQRKLLPKSKCLVWVNTRIIRATNRNEAYRKALSLGKREHPCETNGGEWRFAGISMLLPICEELEDGAEILWTDRGRLPVAAIKKLVKTKRQLPVFDDGEDKNAN